jgi:signal transduction histidine kinase
LPNESPAAAALATLGYALFVREAEDSLRLEGAAPSWLRQLWPALAESGARFPVADASPFLENFLIDAEECWRAGGDQRARSGPWIERNAQGEEVEVEAIAMSANDKSILLFERLGAEFAAKKDVLQRARETVIAHQRLNSEIQKKEILLHYVADEMTAALANIITSLRLIELEDNPPRTKLLLGLAMRGTEEQQILINRVLAVFADEIGTLYGHDERAEGGADWGEVLRGAIEATAAQFADKGVRLVRPSAPEGAVSFSTNAAHLQRVIAGLLENALERTATGNEVTLEFADEGEAIIFRVIDSGARLSPATADNLFSRFELPEGSVPGFALRLHFSRILVESCGGEIGYEPNEAGGNIFWFRLPRTTAT